MTCSPISEGLRQKVIDGHSQGIQVVGMAQSFQQHVQKMLEKDPLVALKFPERPKLLTSTGM